MISTVKVQNWANGLKKDKEVPVEFGYQPVKGEDKVEESSVDVLRKGNDKYKLCVVETFTKGTNSFKKVAEFAQKM